MSVESNQNSQVYGEIETHIPQLTRYAHALARNPVAAEDLVQECLARALEKSHLFQRGTNLRAWLFTILHNLHVGSKRRDAQAGFPVDPDAVPNALSVAPSQEQSMEVGALAKAMRALPRGQRAAIRLVAIDGLPYEEVAKKFDLPIGTIKSRVSRGRTALRRALDGHVVARDGTERLAA